MSSERCGQTVTHKCAITQHPLEPKRIGEQYICITPSTLLNVSIQSFARVLVKNKSHTIALPPITYLRFIFHATYISNPHETMTNYMVGAVDAYNAVLDGLHNGQISAE